MFCCEVVNDGIAHPIYIPLHLIDPTREIASEVERFTRDEGLLEDNPLDKRINTKKILLVFDGLDELASTGKSAAQVAKNFVQAVDRMIERRNLGQNPIFSIISGREIIVQENEKLASLNKKIYSIKNSLKQISRKEAVWIKDLMIEYQEDTLDALLIKVDKIPVSLALAQAVIESGWGTSRFAYEGNALFGQYVWGKNDNGIIPNERDTEAKYKIKSFNSLSESVASYMKNLNTNYHYNEFRINRLVLRSNNIPLNGSLLAEYILNYSIEENYIDKLKKIIQINNFEDFENLSVDKELRFVTEII